MGHFSARESSLNLLRCPHRCRFALAETRGGCIDFAELGFLRTVLNVAIEDGKTDSNPVLSKFFLKENNQRVRYLTAEEVISAVLLFAMGGFFLALQAFGKGHKHAHDLDRAALILLILTPTLSPCSAVIPIFSLVADGGPLLIAIVAALLLVSTVGTMLVLLTRQ